MKPRRGLTLAVGKEKLGMGKEAFLYKQGLSIPVRRQPPLKGSLFLL
jgi:hypothetical protein